MTALTTQIKSLAINTIYPLNRQTAFVGIVALFLLLAGNSQKCLGQTTVAGDSLEFADDTVAIPMPAMAPRGTDIVMLGLSYLPAPGTGSFFERYRTLGSDLRGLDGMSVLGMTIRMASQGAYTWRIDGMYMHPKFIDLYSVYQPGTRNDTGGITQGAALASVVEDFSLVAVPLMAGLDFAPVRTQFTTYVGVGAGVVISSVQWLSTVRRQPLADFYRPGINIKQFGISPAFRVYCGSDLRFDRIYTRNSGMLRGLFLEASYLYAPVSYNYFNAIRGQSRGVPVLPDTDSGMLNIGGFTMTIGISLQLIRP